MLLLSISTPQIAAAVIVVVAILGFTIAITRNHWFRKQQQQQQQSWEQKQDPELLRKASMGVKQKVETESRVIQDICDTPLHLSSTVPKTNKKVYVALQPCTVSWMKENKVYIWLMAYVRYGWTTTTATTWTNIFPVPVSAKVTACVENTKQCRSVLTLTPHIEAVSSERTEKWVCVTSNESGQKLGFQITPELSESGVKLDKLISGELTWGSNAKDSREYEIDKKEFEQSYMTPEPDQPEWVISRKNANYLQKSGALQLNPFDPENREIPQVADDHEAFAGKVVLGMWTLDQEEAEKLKFILFKFTVTQKVSTLHKFFAAFFPPDQFQETIDLRHTVNVGPERFLEKS